MAGGAMGFAGFLAEESGAVTIDWVALAAASTVLGVAVINAIYESGVTSALVVVETEFGAVSTALETPNQVPPAFQ